MGVRIPKQLKKEIVAVSQYKKSRRKKPVVVLEFCCGYDALLRKVGTQQYRHVLWVSLVANVYPSRDGHV